MGRFRELVSLVREKHPSDRFFANYDQKLAIPELGDDYRAYERAFRFLDPESWTELQTKAVNHFMNQRHGQLKQGFFNQLNEAFAYRHLVRRGYQQVRVLRESGKTQPDIAYFNGNEKLFCEVKTLGVSNEEITRRDAPRRFRSSIYYELDEGFLSDILGFARIPNVTPHQLQHLELITPHQQIERLLVALLDARHQFLIQRVSDGRIAHDAKRLFFQGVGLR